MSYAVEVANAMLVELDPTDSKSRVDYMVDFLGSVTGSTDKNGGLLGSDRRYKPFGEVQSGDPVKPLNFAWTGNTGSMHTGLLYSEQYNRARHYSTTTNIWTTRDPLWPNEHPYGYVNGNPVMWTDPQGKMMFVGATLSGTQCALAGRPKGTSPCASIKPKSTGACVAALCSGRGTIEFILFVRAFAKDMLKLPALRNLSEKELLKLLKDLASAIGDQGDKDPFTSARKCCESVSVFLKPNSKLPKIPSIEDAYSVIIAAICTTKNLLGKDLPGKACVSSSKTYEDCVDCCDLLDPSDGEIRNSSTVQCLHACYSNF